MKRNALEEPSHALKRAKKEAAPSALYFDSLPIEVLASVLASLSNLTKKNNRSILAHIPCQEVLELLRVPGMLGEEMKTVYNTLCISPAASQYRWNPRPEEVIGANNIRQALKFLQAAGGKSIETLVVNYLVLGGRTVESIRMHCPNITTLEINSKNVKVWIEKFGGQIKVLEVDLHDNNGIRSIANHCTRLREMTLRSDRPIKIAVCKKSAKTLEYLKIDKSPVTDKQIEKIQESCRALKRISILGNGAAVSKLLASYGNQLEWASLRGFTENDARRVASACKEARFDLNEPNALLPALNLLGNQLDTINVSLHNRPSDMREYEAAWNRCTNLRCLFISGCNGAQLQMVLTSPKAMLTTFWAARGSDFENNSSTIDSNRFTAALDGCLNLQTLYLKLCALTLVQVEEIMTTPKVYLYEVYIKLVWKPTYSRSSAGWRSCIDDDEKKAKQICREACKNGVKIDVSIDYRADPDYNH